MGRYLGPKANRVGLGRDLNVSITPPNISLKGQMVHSGRPFGRARRGVFPVIQPRPHTVAMPSVEAWR